MSTTDRGPRETLPFDWYSDPAVLTNEHERIFRRLWQYVGHLGQIPEPGSLAAGRAGDVPVLVVRDLEGQVRAFLNVCRHRGAQLLDGEVQRSAIQCPYHAWTYDLDGRLRKAPRSETEDEFDREALGLVPLAVDTWGPFVFVNPDAGADPLSETLGELPGLVAAAGVDVDALVFHSRCTSSLSANWKVCCENFLECYHCPVAHPGLANVIDLAEDSYRLEESRWFSTQYGPVKESWAGGFDPSGAVDHGQFHLLFPNLTININPGSPNISLGPVLPESTEQTTRFLDYFFAPDADSDWIESFMRWDGEVGEQDARLVEGVQRGVRAGMLDRGVLLRSERLIAHFDRLVIEHLEG